MSGTQVGNVDQLQGVASQLEQLVALVSKQNSDLQNMQKGQESLRQELKALRLEHEALQTGVEDMRSPTMTLKSPPGSARDTKATGKDASSGFSKTDKTQLNKSGRGEVDDNIAIGKTMSTASVGDGGAKSASKAGRERTLAEEEALEDERRGGIYGICQPLLRHGTKEKLKVQTLAKVEAALRGGENPHSWAGPATPLQVGVKSRSIDLVRTLLEAQGSPDERDSKGVSLLHQASYDGQVEMARLLIEMHGDPNALDRYGQTPLFFAPTRSVCELLYKSYADVNTMNHKDYARKTGVRPEAILKVEQVAGGGLTRDWNRMKQKSKHAGAGRNAVAPGFEVAGGTQSIASPFGRSKDALSDLNSEATSDMEESRRSQF